VQRSDLDELIRKARATDWDGGTKPEPASTQTLPVMLGH
jgi:hypothetical protein